MMNAYESAYLHFSYSHDQPPPASAPPPPPAAESSEYPDARTMYGYNVAQQPGALMGLPNGIAKPNETKPRLGKDEVEILEREFQKNPKPTTQTKRGFAEEMCVDLARINNWFQNRRAKRKQERRQEAFEKGQQNEAAGGSEPSSPDFFAGGAYYNTDNIVPLQHAATFPMMSGPPPAVASYNPQYSDPASASMESLQRTFAAAQAGHNAPEQNLTPGLMEHNDVLGSFGMPLANSASSDRAQFPTASDSLASFDNGRNYSYPTGHAHNIYSAPSSLMDAQDAAEQLGGKTPTQFDTHHPAMDRAVPQLMTTFPSQLLPMHSQDTISQASDESAASCFSFDFGYDIQQPDEDSLIPPPSSNLPFRSPPAPMDIASRRKKVQVKPAALAADTMRGRPSMGPRTVSQAEGLRRLSDSPLSSPMRRIVSAGGNRNGMSGRIQKPGVESAQRSPINFGGFADASAFMEHNYQNIRNPPALTAGSTLNNSLAPPTPMSPREREMTLLKSERSTASPSEGISFVFNTGVPGCFAAMEGDQNLASPPETPQAHLGLHPASNGWPSTAEFEDKQWHYEVPDEPLYTPGHDAFPSEIHMPQPSYLSSSSQPVTPAFGQFNTAFPFGYESPQMKHETTAAAYARSNQSAEYVFPESQLQFAPGMLNSPSSQNKTFQFANSTAADFLEK